MVILGAADIGSSRGEGVGYWPLSSLGCLFCISSLFIEFNSLDDLLAHAVATKWLLQVRWKKRGTRIVDRAMPIFTGGEGPEPCGCIEGIIVGRAVGENYPGTRYLA
jgi:hypothetical protein